MNTNVSVRLFEPPTLRGRGRLKIVLLKLDHIGDFLTAIEAFRILREAFADAEITLICLPALVVLAESTKLFDKVKGFAAVHDSAQLGKVPTMGSYDRVDEFKALLDGPYFLAADFRHDPHDRFGLDHVDAECRAAFSAITRKGLDIVIPTMEWDAPPLALDNGNLPVHAGVRLRLLAHAIVETLLEKPWDAGLFNPSQDLAATESYRALKTEQRLKVGVSLGAGSELRKWKNDYWCELLPRLIQRHNAVIVFFGGAGDQAETQAVAAPLAPGSFIDLTGAVPLAAVPAYMKMLDAYIGCDTGLTHLAASLHLPTVNMFAGISNVSVWRAKGPRVKTVYAEVICAPCHLRFKADCPNNNICMQAIVPDIVYACFEQVIALPESV